MSPVKAPAKAAREEFGAARSTKPRGGLRRQALQRRPEEFTDAGSAASHHVEEHRLEPDRALPREDRAG